jgi:Chaperone of endosialidase
MISPTTNLQNVEPNSHFALLWQTSPAKGMTVCLTRTRWSFLFSLLASMYAALFSTANAVTPAPDGGYPYDNTAEGDMALYRLQSGVGSNTAVGSSALQQDETGNFNTAVGAYALFADTTGAHNTAIGSNSMDSYTTGNENTAIGYEALGGVADANGNPASTGSYNTATGSQALPSNRDGGVNVANGYSALNGNVSGFYNVACGGFALGTNTAGSYNVATGANALYYNTGSNNTATGHQALQKNTTGTNNVAVGFQAGNSLTTGSNNIVIGAGVLGKAGEANTTRIGKTTQAKTYIGGIYNKTIASGVGVIVNSSGQLGTVQSSARYKDDIKPMNKASEAILALKPVTFRYKEQLDPDHIPQFGLIAEEVEKIDPDLVARDEEGKVTTVRYEAVNAMLLNEFLKAHKKLEAQETIIDQQQNQIAAQKLTAEQQQKQITALTAAVQRVSDQLELDRREVAANDQ